MAENEELGQGHSIFRPSYSATWLYCEDALVSGLDLPDSGGYDAAVGTVFHDLMAEWQTSGRPDYRLGTTEHLKSNDGTEEWDIVVDEDMFSFGEECLARLEEFEGERFVEHRVDISDLTPIPDQGGTGDVIIPTWRVLRVVDYKYGTGVQVFADKNSQLCCYGWGAFKEFDWIYGFEEIELWIFQPRLRHYDVFRLSRQELIEWADWARVRAAAAWKKTGRTRTPSPKACQWCRVREDCAAMEQLREDLADLSFDVDHTMVFDPKNNVLDVRKPSEDFEFPEAAKLKTEQLAYIRRYRKLMEAWFKDIDDALIERINEGEDGHGWRVVEGRTRRKWRDEKETAAKLEEAWLTEEQIWQFKLKPVGELRKYLRATGLRGKALDDFLNEMRYHPKGQPSLVPDADNRASLPDYGATFDEDSEEL